MTADAAFRIQGRERPALPVPQAPYLYEADQEFCLKWRGCAGAESYQFERSRSADGEFEPVGESVLDDGCPMDGFRDFSAGCGVWYYRVRAQNTSGVSKPSNVVKVDLDTEWV